jgi:hypothetical protein
MKESEREVFRLFCALRGMNPGEFKEMDPPDFVHQSGGLAIELVGYHQDYGPKGGSKLREREETIYRRVAEGRLRR